MTISELSVRRPVLMTMVYVLIMIIAAIFISNLDMALYPTVDMPVLSVVVSCEDAGPEEIEQQVAIPLENALSSVTDLDTMTSISSDGNCMVILEFDYSTDLDEAKDDVESMITRVTRQLPDWADTPTVIDFNAASNTTVVTLTLSGDRSLAELQSIADDDISPLLERIDGVAEVDTFGGSESEYQVNVDQNRLEAYDLSLQEVASALGASDSMVSIGEITENDYDYQLSADNRFNSLEEIENAVVAVRNGYAVKVSDIATISESTDRRVRRSYLNGEQVVTMLVSADSDSSETQVAKDVIASLDSIREVLPSDVILTLQRDSTEMIASTMSEVYSSAVEGVLLAALVIFIFLRGIKTTFIITISMPISILITLMAMSVFDISINSMSMSGLILGIGMIVDASIIILENTYTIRATGEKSAASAILGSKNMTTAILASTLTTLCVFLPLLIYRYDLGMIGMMFQDLIITVCISLTSSLFVAITLVPALCGSILKINTRTQKPLKNKVLRSIDNAMTRTEEAMKNGYARSLSYFLSHRLLLIMLLVLLLVYSLTYIGNIGLSMTPQMTTDDEVSLSLTLPAGTTNTVTSKEIFAMQDKIKEVLPADVYESISLEVGSSNEGSITISLPDITEQTMSASAVKDAIRPFLYDNPDADWTFSAGRGPSSSNAIDIEIKSEDTAKASAVASDIMSLLRTVDGIADVTTDLEDGDPRIDIIMDTDTAEQLGVTLSDVAAVLQNAVTGITATELSAISTDESYDLIVKLQDTDVDTLEKLGAITMDINGNQVRLDTFCTFGYSTSPSSIRREDKVQVNHVEATLLDGYDSSTVQASVDKTLDEKLVLPDGVEIADAGEMAQMAEYLPTLVQVIILALFLVYAVMAAQFESLADPFIIFLTIPLVIIGVIWIHITTDTAITLFSIVGIVALIGVAVNNGIVLVDCINRLLKGGMHMQDACLEAAKGRLRPILMTTLTTILGMIPMAFFPGDGAEMMQPIALTFVGGLATGAFLTLYLSPVLYTIINRKKEERIRRPDSLESQLKEFDMRRLRKLDEEL